LSARVKAKKQFLLDLLQGNAALINRRIELLDEELLQAEKSESLEERLEAQAWIPAKSGKCDYVKDAPQGLVEAIRASKDGIIGASYHFTAAKAEPTLFRFERRTQ